ncbi:hypothetical protein GY45DRAFT_1375250 [Cubamyces sp. BRFM 1775]|nr:hypothetical protein GY45DRAFT_1375250 [Cubamyces sp. BRFM 1775]
MASGVPTPPPGLNYVAAIEPMLGLLLLDAVLASFLIPITVILFYFSTSTTRWKPVFLMNVAGIVFTLTLSILNITNQTTAILARPANRAMDAGSVYMMILTPFCAELVLILRVIAAYPLWFMYWPARILVYGPIVAFKTARIVNIVIFIIRWVPLDRHAHDPFQLGQIGWNLVNIKIEWGLQFLDMTFVSALFLARLRQGYGFQQIECTSDAFPAGLCTEATHPTLSSRIRTLFWIAASNLVVPVLLTFIQLVFVFRDDDFLHGTYVFFVNVHVQILGVLLATIWSTGSQRSEPSTMLLPVGVDTDNDNSGRGCERTMTSESRLTGGVGLRKAIVSSTEWLSTWTVESDGIRPVATLDLEGQKRAKDPELIGATGGHDSRKITLRFPT